MKRAEGGAQKVFAKCAHRCCKFFFLLSSELFINIFVTIKALVTQCLIPKMGTEKWSFKKIRDRNKQKKTQNPPDYFIVFLAGILEPVVP